jgi:hypothetical protein
MTTTCNASYAAGSVVHAIHILYSLLNSLLYTGRPAMLGFCIVYSLLNSLLSAGQDDDQQR